MDMLASADRTRVSSITALMTSPLFIDAYSAHIYHSSWCADERVIYSYMWQQAPLSEGGRVNLGSSVSADAVCVTRIAAVVLKSG